MSQFTYYSIKVPFTENDLQELQSGESFNWTFPDAKNPNILINVELIQQDDDEK